MKFVVVLVLISCLLSCAPIEKVSTVDEIEYSFFVAGHVYGHPGVNNVGVHPPFKNKFVDIKNHKSIQFGVFTGDIVVTGTERNWNEIDADIAELDKPVFFAVGNHDVTNRKLLESRYGITYSSFVVNKDLCILLDPNLDGWDISGKQLEFLKKELLKAHQFRNIYVFFHQVLWWTDNNIFSGFRMNSKQHRKDSINFWTEVEPLFSKLPNNVWMFAGDVGAFPRGDEFMYYEDGKNITYVASGMGGGVRDNFVIVNVSGNGNVSFDLIALNDENSNALGNLKDYSFE